MHNSAPSRLTGLLAAIGPGILVAATGVGAGDLATGAFTGSKLGVAVLWAVVLGAFLKFAVTEGIARWQLATGDTFLEGAVAYLGRPVAWLFFPYLFLWTFFVGSALMSACGVTVHAMVPVFDDPVTGKQVFGVIHSALGAALVLAGGFALFERVMGVCIAVMFAVVVVTAVLLTPDLGEILTGLFAPQIPETPGPDGADTGQGTVWTVALMGGVGGTLTVLCYGYWIREKGRHSLGELRACRIDLAVGYAMTAIFGLAMVVIGSTVVLTGKGAGLVVMLAERLEQPLGPAGKWAFLIGAWGAVFSSLLGVWQAVPYLFADLLSILRRGTPAPGGGESTSDRQPDDEDKPDPAKPDLTGTLAYRGYLAAITFIPMLGLWLSFKEVQKLYAFIGALFVPMLAVALLVLNGRRRWLGAAKNSIVTNLVLVATVVFFGWLAARKWLG